MAVYNQEWKGLTEAVITRLGVCEAVEVRENMPAPKLFRTDNAMWDTGATNSLLSQKIVDELGLKPHDKAYLSGASGVDVTYTYLVHVLLPTGNVVLDVEALLGDNDDYDFVVGMDIISKGDFAFTNKDGKSVFSFRYPSKEHVRFGE